MNTVELEKTVASLQETVARLEKQLAGQAAAQDASAAISPNLRIAAALNAKAMARLDRQEKAAREISKSKTVRCRVLRQQTRKIEGKRISFDVSQPIVLNSTWRKVWPEAPTQLLAFDEKGEPVIHTLPERVFQALQPELVKV